MEEFSKQENLFFVALASAMIIVSLVLVALLLLSRPIEPYNELYFDLDSIQEKALVGDELPFTFFVENHEDRQMDYTYSVLVGGEELKQGELSLADGEQREVNEKVLLSSAGEQKVEVKLENAFQDKYSIFFWIDVGE